MTDHICSYLFCSTGLQKTEKFLSMCLCCLQPVFAMNFSSFSKCAHKQAKNIVKVTCFSLLLNETSECKPCKVMSQLLNQTFPLPCSMNEIVSYGQSPQKHRLLYWHVPHRHITLGSHPKGIASQAVPNEIVLPACTCSINRTVKLSPKT